MEDLDVDFIKNKIERQSPILPSLIGINLIHGNSLTDNIFENKTFDCIAANPPWGSVPNDEEEENIKERKAIGGKGIEGEISEYKNVSDFQRSQAFLLRVKKWSSSKTVFGLIVNNSIFLNEKAEDFRKDFLKEYRLDSFFELSKLNKILFRKRKIEEEKKNPFSQNIELLENQIDELVFDLYELTEFEKSIIKEFYDINVHRKEENANKVRPSDLKAYFNKFKEIFELVLNENLTIDATYKISNNIGAFMVFQIKEKQLANDELVQNSLSDVEVFHAMKKVLDFTDEVLLLE